MTSSTSGPTAVASNLRSGAASGINGHALGGGKGPAPGGRPGPYPHIDDLLHVNPDGDASQSLNHLLTTAENGVNFAKFQVDIGRIDVALKEYIKAYMIAINVIPNHKDYVSLQADRKNFVDRYNRLTRTLLEYADVFENIKRTIKEDNARTGVHPTSRRPASNGRPSTPKSPANFGPRHQRNTSSVSYDGFASPASNTASPGRARPAIQPKPANLHGNAIKSQAPLTDQAEDLKQRFANLRSPPSTPVQDPRIRTRPPPVPIPPDKPAGPREMPQPASGPGRPAGPRDMPRRPTISLQGVAPVLPKLPDAIYSPARGNISTEVAELPSSTPRGMYSRANSSVGFYNSNNGTNNSSTNLPRSVPSQDYFGPSGSTAPTSAPSKRRVSLPEGDIISVEELVKYQKIGSKDFHILLIDVRPRAEFEEGHILSSATICIEPDILQRPRIEAADVEDAMELGPAQEKWHFERRHEFDMVVFYDQDSYDLSSERSNAPAKLFRLLTDFDYPEGDPGSKHPKLLKGGLEAWQDAMGGSALQKSTKPSHKRRKSAYDKLWVRSPTKPIQSAEEARRWEQKLTQLRNDEIEGSDAENFQPVRSVNEFLIRYPPIQESMASPAMEDGFSGRLPIRTAPQRAPHPAHFEPILPAEPMRPPPAVPRRSYTGLREPEDDHSTTKKVKRRADAARRRAVGLQNPGSWCYANSTLQALFASGGFGEELMSGEWSQLYKSPMKGDEKIMPPQLLTKIVAHLFHWMGNGRFPSMEAKTLMGKRVDDSEIFGTTRQQDAMEFFVYVFTELDDETNRLRDRPSKVPQPEPSKGKTQLDLAIQYWDLHSRVNDSLIDKYWRTLEALIVRCDRCGHVVTQYENKDMLILNLPKRSHPVTMEDLLQTYFSNELLDSYKCDNCAHVGCCRRGPRLARLPDLLCVCFARFEVNEYGRRSKISTTVDFPIRELDMTPYTIQGQQAYSSLLSNGNGSGNLAVTSPSAAIRADDHHFTKPFKYEAYAVVQHGGELTGGHYISIIRDEPHGPDGTSRWHVADDSKISEITHWSSMEAYMVFYQRKDVGLV
ncbi:Ubiquitin carboxyl-terminal hydrolase 4 [Cytospora mali]|uniref:Ubiquitin carboxyl-terminal hydrolase 4 n=1 Tax=Cytospora mali TaxID=578113 RepID=A0A194UN47_CYTMA|nr:Ubiquitin carboxyl-terminal hydrolase 4 [Valsa mali var. pyri (nom. inval.)]